MARLGVGARIGAQPRLALTPALRQSIAILALDAAALDALLAEEAQRNPFLLRRPPRGAADLPEARAAGDSLFALVARQIERAFPQGPDRALAFALAGHLAPSGWFEGDAAAVAAGLGRAPAAGAAVLARLQAFEPPGLFARTLAECLALQAAEAGLLDPAMAAVLARLDLLAARGAEAVAASAGLPAAQVAARAAALRRFDPKPGARFDAGAPPAAPPDVVLRAGPAGPEVAPGPGLPLVALRDGPADDPARRAAAALVAAVERREATLLAVARQVLAHQAAALAGGPAALLPLTRAQVAAALGLSGATVSRAVAAARVAAPGGTRPLAAWLSPAVVPGVSAAALQALLRALVAAEDRAAPLDDAALAARLAAQGVRLARRTVAKHRAAAGIPPGPARRRQP